MNEYQTVVDEFKYSVTSSSIAGLFTQGLYAYISMVRLCLLAGWLR